MKSFNARVHPIFGLMVVFLLTGLLSFPLQAQAAAKVVTGEIVNLVVDADNCLLGTTMCTEIGTSGAAGSAWQRFWSTPHDAVD